MRLAYSAIFLLGLVLTGQLSADQKKVGITADLQQVETTHQGAKVVIERNQDVNNTLLPAFQKTARHCPPFCIQPASIADGVETIGELEMLEYLRKIGEGADWLRVIDSRGERWLRRGTIPGSVNIPFQKLSLRSSSEAEIATIMQDVFGAEKTPDGEFWNFRPARTLVLFCNGMWCGQAATNIRSLLRIGYPPEKLKWYRGGMQDWEILGLTRISDQ